MKISTWRLNLLIGLNCFILFFLLFEHLVRIPSWMQPVGRMHPMILHFPIVLLLIAGVVVNFRKKLEGTFPVARLIRELLFVSAFTAAVTVIMGLFLAQEDGYEGSSFQWHKWTGIGICFLSLVLVLMQGLQSSRYRFLFTAFTNLCLLLVLIAGHFGAELTHGEDFVLAPLQEKDTEVFDINTAKVFDNAILPILKAKCLSCHNTSKSKGALILTDSASIAKGGDTGPLFVAGNTSESLLIQRLLLDIEHEHRMPPKGKPQLTPEELALIQAWVRHGAKFGTPVAALQPGDSLLLAIGAIYQVKEKESFDFPAADAGKIAGLSTPYRVIQPLADGSPALSVNFYGVGFYTDQSLADLEPIAEQVVSLNLSGMPVTAKALETIVKFKNLRELNLNNTPVKDENIAGLKVLPKLKSVGLSGTAVTTAGVKNLLANEALRRVYVWNTSVTNEEAAGLSKSFPAKQVDIGFIDDGQTVLPLTIPQIVPAQSFFRDELQVTMSHPIPGVEIRYSLDGKEPDSLNSLVFTKPITIKRNQQLLVKAFKKGWGSSQVVERRYIQSKKVPDRVVLLEKPHYLYAARNERSFFDMESGGTETCNHADGKWQGYFQTPLSVALYFNEPANIDTFALSVMQNYVGINMMTVYAPEYIEVWGGADSAQARLLTRLQPPVDKLENLERRRLIYCPVKATNLRYLKVIAQPWLKIPDGFPAAGANAWMYVDEIILK